MDEASESVEHPTRQRRGDFLKETNGLRQRGHDQRHVIVFISLFLDEVRLYQMIEMPIRGLYQNWLVPTEGGPI